MPRSTWVIPMGECWRLKCSDEATHRVLGSGAGGTVTSVTTCESCAKDLTEDGKWDRYEPLSESGGKNE